MQRCELCGSLGRGKNGTNDLDYVAEWVMIDRPKLVLTLCRIGCRQRVHDMSHLKLFERFPAKFCKVLQGNTACGKEDQSSAC